MRAKGLQPEARLPFAGLRQLQPVLGEVRGMLPAQRDALLRALGMASVSDPAPFRVALAALELLAESAADVADDAVGVERLPSQLGLDYKGRAVELLRRSEYRADKAVRDHEMMAHRDAVHGFRSQS